MHLDLVKASGFKHKTPEDLPVHINTNNKNKKKKKDPESVPTGADVVQKKQQKEPKVMTVSRIMRGSVDEENRETWEDKQAALGKCLDLHFCVQTEDK